MSQYPIWEDWAARRPVNGHYVYRFHNSEGVLLYVGRTNNLWRRFGHHAEGKDWWPQVDWDRTLVETISPVECYGKTCALPEHALMRAHEAYLIEHLRPVHNIRDARCFSGRHDMTEDNIYISPKSGAKTCRACLAENRRNWAASNPEKVREYRRRNGPRNEFFRRPRFRFKRPAPTAGQSSLF